MPKIIHDTEVFKAAIKIFTARGYTATTTKDIATAVGIDESTLFRKYGNKANLINQTFNQQFSNVPLSKIVSTGNLEDDLLSIVVAYMETTKIHGPVLPMLLSEIPRNPELMEALDSIWANIQGIITVIQQYQMQGLLRCKSPIECVSVLLGPIMANQIFQSANPELSLPIIDLKEYVDAFLHGRKT
jgi:AcrR family transcriptional regulator